MVAGLVTERCCTLLLKRDRRIVNLVSVSWVSKTTIAPWVTYVLGPADKANSLAHPSAGLGAA